MDRAEPPPKASDLGPPPNPWGWLWFATCCAGFAAVLCLPTSARSGTWWVASVASAAGVLLCLWRQLWRDLAGNHYVDQFVLFSLGAATLLVVTLIGPSRGIVASLEVQPTGERNAAAQGSEVWVLELGPAEGAAFDPSVWTPSGDWQRRDKAWVSVGDPRASLRWSGQATEGLRLKLLSHAWSGVTLVRWGDTEQRIDLYGKESGQRAIELPLPPQPLWRRILKALLLLTPLPVATALCALLSLVLSHAGVGTGGGENLPKAAPAP